MTRKSLVELAAAASVTDTSTTQISETQGKEWMDRVVLFAQANRMFDQSVATDNSLVGKGDNTLTVTKTTSVLTVDSAPSGGEGDVRDNTEMTNIDTVSLIFATSDFYRGKISISKQIALTSRVDLVSQARYAIAQSMAEDVDNNLATTLQSPTITNVNYGGVGNTAVSGIATGDTMTPDLIADAMADVETSNWSPAMVFLAPAQIKAFRKDSQFVNAAEYGDNAVVLKGEIGNYLGLRILKTTNTPAYALGATDTNETPTVWGAAGHACPLVAFNNAGVKVAGILAWKEMPHVDYEYRPDEALHKVYYDQAFKSAIVQPTAVSLIKVADA